MIINITISVVIALIFAKPIFTNIKEGSGLIKNTKGWIDHLTNIAYHIFIVIFGSFLFIGNIPFNNSWFFKSLQFADIMKYVGLGISLLSSGIIIHRVVEIFKKDNHEK